VSDRLDYIAKRYAETLIESAIEDAAQDQLGEFIGYQADDDGLELSIDETDYLRNKTYDYMIMSRTTIEEN
jgi:hypothetical protein